MSPASGSATIAAMRGCALLLWTAMLAMLGCQGGVQRTIHISSEPAGALVHLNDVEVGRTPLEVPFKFYGVYDVRLTRDGYDPLWTTGKARAPWWEYPGPDLLAEAVPGAESRVDWHFTLDEATPPAEVDVDAVLDRAEQMRDEVRR